MKLLIALSVLLSACLGRSKAAGNDKMYNVLWILLDDISTERFPESGNTALEGLLPGFDQFKEDGAVYYSHFYSPSSICAPSQVALFSGIEPADIGGQYQFSTDVIDGKLPYATVPPPEVQFVTETLRELGYWSVGGGKLDYQVGDFMPTFYNEVAGGGFSDITSYQDRVWDPAIELDRPFYGMLNAMDMHQLLSTYSREAPIGLTNPEGGLPPLPFGQFGYTRPLSLLFNTGENGSPKPEQVTRVNVEVADIVGYGGAFDETTLTHENGGVPGYLPEDIGVQSILAREYDLIRNFDYRLTKIIEALKTRNVYDDTLVIVFGDHGSGTYKAKGLLEPQSIRTPMWIKYPKEMELPSSTKTETASDGSSYLADDRMVGITDLYPTTLSVLGVSPPDYITGKAFAGDFDVGPTRDTMFAIVQRAGSKAGWKSFAAFTKEHFYQRNLVTEEIIDEYSQTLSEDELAATLGTVPEDSLFAGYFDLFAAAPLFERVRRLIRLNAEDQGYLQSYAFIATDDATAPSEVFYDLATDPYGTNNLIVDYTYDVIYADSVQPSGTNVSKVTVGYSPVAEDELSETDLFALEDLRSKLDTWIESQTWVTPDFVFGEGSFAEENEMAKVFWPDGTQPKTSNIEIGDIVVSDAETGMAKAELVAPTPGTVIRYTVASPEIRSSCEQISAERKEGTPLLSIFSNGVSETEYTSIRNGRTYTGFHYNVGDGYDVRFTNFIGSITGCEFFMSSDATFIEMFCPGDPVYAFDTRDSIWDGTTWVGIDVTTGEWLGAPVSFWDEANSDWNYDAFHDYVFGPLRGPIFRGTNPDGSKFIPSNPSQIPLNYGYNPPPKYWVTDEDVTIFPERSFVSQSIIPIGWGISAPASFFRSNQSPGLDDKGSFRFTVLNRIGSPPRFDTLSFTFESFKYDCLVWEVGTKASLNFDSSDGNEGLSLLHVFTQGVRKGYSDSEIVEKLLYFDSGSVSEESPMETMSPVAPPPTPAPTPLLLEPFTSSPVTGSPSGSSRVWNGEWTLVVKYVLILFNAAVFLVV